MKTKTIMKTKMKIKMNFPLSFSFSSLILLAQTCHRRSTVSYLAQKCHGIFAGKFCMWLSSTTDGQLSLDWAGSATEPGNKAPSLIRICRIQSCSSLSLLLTRNTLFGQNWSENQNCQFKVKPRLIQICRIQWCLFFLFRPEILFLGKFGPILILEECL